MVGKNDVCAVTDEQIAVDIHARSAESIDFFHEGKGIEDDPVADHTAAALAQNAAGDEL